MKLRQTFAILLIVITVMLSGVVYGQLEYTKQQSIDRAESLVNETATLTADQIDDEITRQRDYVGYYASRAGASNVSDARPFLNEFLSNPRFYAVQMVDANGTVLAFQGDIVENIRNETEGANVSNRSYVSVPLSTGNTYVSEPQRVNSTGQYVIIIGAPIFEGNQVTGVLAAAIELNRFTTFSPLVALQTKSQTVTVTDGSTVLYEPETRFESATTGRATLSTTDWVVEVHRDRQPLETQLRRMALLQSGSLLLVLLSVIVLAGWQYRVSLRQTEKLLEGFEALRREDFDYDPSLHAAEEWEKINEGFNDLSTILEERELAIKEREERLSVLNRVLRHNLRNDMTIILSYARRIADEAESDRLREAGRTIEEQGESLVSLGESARHAAESMERSDETVEMDLAEQSERILEELHSDYPATEISFSAPDRTSVTVVPRFERAITNVMENAFEHNNANSPRITVRVTTEDGYGTLVVADNGPGVPEQELAALEGTEEPLEHGSGLGLWLAYWLIRKSNGRLVVEENEPRGTVVKLTVPLSE